MITAALHAGSEGSGDNVTLQVRQGKGGLKNQIVQMSGYSHSGSL